MFHRQTSSHWQQPSPFLRGAHYSTEHKPLLHPAPALARTVHRTALPTRLGHSGQAPLAAPRQSMPTHRLAWGQQATCPLGGQEHTHLSCDSAPAPQSQLRALQHPTVHCAPGRGLNWHLDSWSHPLCKQQALLLLALMP